MGVLKRREEPTATMTLRLPTSVKAEIDRLRERASDAGFDLNVTISESIVRLARQMREEIDALDGQSAEAQRSRKPARANGLSPSAQTVPRGAVDCQGEA
jgi:hypothetical protein